MLFDVYKKWIYNRALNITYLFHVLLATCKNCSKYNMKNSKTTFKNVQKQHFCWNCDKTIHDRVCNFYRGIRIMMINLFEDTADIFCCLLTCFSKGLM